MSVEPIRELNKSGLQAFSTLISDTRESEARGGGQLEPQWELLSNPAATKELGSSAVIDGDQVFQTRFELATYVNAALDPVFHESLYSRVGLWAWLALFYFRQLRSTPDTQRAEHFIPDEWAKQTPGQDLGYRHSVRTGVRILRLYGVDFAKFFLLGRPVHQMGDIVEQFMSRPKVLRSERIRATMLQLYQGRSGGFKQGAATRPSKSRRSDAGRGGIRRFAYTYVPRVKLGYDIDAMTVENIISVCGPEISQSRFAAG